MYVEMYNVIFETMNAISQTIGLTLVASLLTCCSVSAQRHPRRHYYPRSVVTVVAKTAATVCVSSRFNQKERLQIAVAYLEHNPYLSVRQYAKMTGLPKDMAEAELDAFACDKRNPVTLVILDRKKLYTRR